MNWHWLNDGVRTDTRGRGSGFTGVSGIGAIEEF